MLRRQNYSVDLAQVQYVAPPAKKCVTKSQREKQIRKDACGTGELKPQDVDEMGTTIYKVQGTMLDTITKLNNQYKDHGCNPLAPPCIPVKKCLAKTSTLHDGTDNVSHDIVGLGVKGDANMGYLYNTYRETSIIDTQELIRQIRANNAPIQSAVTKQAEYNAGLYGGSFHAIDGVPTGYTCIKCPPRKRVCNPYPPKCKIPDPNNPETGIGSDMMQSKDSLLGLFEAKRIDPQVSVSDFRKAEGDRLDRSGYQDMDAPMDMNAQQVAMMVNYEGTQEETTSLTEGGTPTSYASIPPRELEPEQMGVLGGGRLTRTPDQRAAQRAEEMERFGQPLEGNDYAQFTRGILSRNAIAMERLHQMEKGSK